MVVNVVRASRLKVADVGGVSDPYAVVKIANGQEFRTKVQYETLHPYWNEIFVATLEEDDLNNARLDDIAVTIKIVDKDSFGADDFIGQVSIPWKDLVQLETMFPAKWLRLTLDSEHAGNRSSGDFDEQKRSVTFVCHVSCLAVSGDFTNMFVVQGGTNTARFWITFGVSSCEK